MRCTWSPLLTLTVKQGKIEKKSYSKSNDQKYSYELCLSDKGLKDDL